MHNKMEVLTVQLSELSFSYNEFVKEVKRTAPKVEETKVEEPVEEVPEPVAEEPKVDVEAIKAEAFAEGKTAGEKEGFATGSKSGFSEGFERGVTEGTAKGKEEGLTLGRQEATQSVPQHNVKDIETLGSFFAFNLLLNNQMQIENNQQLNEIFDAQTSMAFRHTETYLKALAPEFTFESLSGTITNILRNVVEKSEHFAGPNVTFKQMVTSLESAQATGTLATETFRQIGMVPPAYPPQAAPVQAPVQTAPVAINAADLEKPVVTETIEKEVTPEEVEEVTPVETAPEEKKEPVKWAADSGEEEESDSP